MALLVWALAFATVAASYPQYGPQSCTNTTCPSTSDTCVVLALHGNHTIGVSCSSSHLKQNRYGPRGELCFLGGSATKANSISASSIQGLLFSHVGMSLLSLVLSVVFWLMEPKTTPFTLFHLLFASGSLLYVSHAFTPRAYTFDIDVPFYGNLHSSSFKNANLGLISGLSLLTSSVLVIAFSVLQIKPAGHLLENITKAASADKSASSSSSSSSLTSSSDANKDTIASMTTTAQIAMYGSLLYALLMVSLRGSLVGLVKPRSACDRKLIDNDLDMGFTITNVVVAGLAVLLHLYVLFRDRAHVIRIYESLSSLALFSPSARVLFPLFSISFYVFAIGLVVIQSLALGLYKSSKHVSTTLPLEKYHVDWNVRGFFLVFVCNAVFMFLLVVGLGAKIYKNPYNMMSKLKSIKGIRIQKSFAGHLAALEYYLDTHASSENFTEYEDEEGDDSADRRQGEMRHLIRTRNR